MPKHEEVHEKRNDQRVVAALAGSHEPRSARELARILGLKHEERRSLQRILQTLKHRREIEEPQPGRYRLPGQKQKAETHAVRPDGRAAGARPEQSRRGHAGAVQQRKASGPGPGPAKAKPHDPNVITGRLVAHRDGYGFVVPDEPVPRMEGDLFIGRDKLGDAMHGDRVVARIERRAGDARAEGRILEITRRAHPTIVGLFQYGPRENRVVPFDTRILQDIIIPPGEEIPAALKGEGRSSPPASAAHKPVRGKLPELEGAVVNVELTRFPRGGVLPAGRVVEIVGRPGEPGIDVEIIVRKNHLPDEFPDEVLAAAAASSQQVSAAEREGRLDVRHLPIVTIDGETAKDFDDAVHVARLPGGNYELQVHIADVAHYVARSSPLDREARLRGTSVYFPDRAIPMLPEALSNGICSLNPQVERLVMSAVMEMDPRGHVVRAEFAPGVICSAERMTYTNVNKVLEGDVEASKRYAALAEHFRLMRELALILNAKRMRRGSIDFDLPEQVFEYDDLGQMTKIVRSERNIAHRIIEEFMLAANEAVAAYLEGRAIASLHRVHEKPDAKKVLEFEELARAFGYSLGVADLAERHVPVKHGKVPSHGRTRAGQRRERQMVVALPETADLRITPHHYQRLTEKIAGKPEERILSYLMLRSLKQARYAPEPLGHFALGAEHYTHFTSPIRRYPDLIVHRLLKGALASPRGPQGLKPAHEKEEARAAGLKPRPDGSQKGLYGAVELEEIAAETSDAERRAAGAEREVMDWKTAAFMEQHLGEEYDALITSVQKFGFFVELMEIFVEGLVPVATLEELAGDRLIYRERDRALITSRGRRTWRMGDRVRVRADRIDHFRHRVEFAVVVATDKHA